MKLRIVFATAMLLGLLSGCSSGFGLPHTDLKSPCVGADGSPCARHPVNDWWLNQHDQNEDS